MTQSHTEAAAHGGKILRGVLREARIQCMVYS